MAKAHTEVVHVDKYLPFGAKSAASRVLRLRTRSPRQARSGVAATLRHIDLFHRRADDKRPNSSLQVEATAPVPNECKPILPMNIPYLS